MCLSLVLSLTPFSTVDGLKQMAVVRVFCVPSLSVLGRTSELASGWPRVAGKKRQPSNPSKSTPLSSPTSATATLWLFSLLSSSTSLVDTLLTLSTTSLKTNDFARSPSPRAAVVAAAASAVVAAGVGSNRKRKGVFSCSCRCASASAVDVLSSARRVLQVVLLVQAAVASFDDRLAVPTIRRSSLGTNLVPTCRSTRTPAVLKAQQGFLGWLDPVTLSRPSYRGRSVPVLTGSQALGR